MTSVGRRSVPVCHGVTRHDWHGHWIGRIWWQRSCQCGCEAQGTCWCGGWARHGAAASGRAPGASCGARGRTRRLAGGSSSAEGAPSHRLLPARLHSATQGASPAAMQRRPLPQPACRGAAPLGSRVPWRGRDKHRKRIIPGQVANPSSDVPSEVRSQKDRTNTGHLESMPFVTLDA
jgi:hypothetical protein